MAPEFGEIAAQLGMINDKQGGSVLGGEGLKCFA
jgi:hypothetical protein